MNFEFELETETEFEFEIPNLDQIVNLAAYWASNPIIPNPAKRSDPTFHRVTPSFRVEGLT